MSKYKSKSKTCENNYIRSRNVKWASDPLQPLVGHSGNIMACHFRSLPLSMPHFPWLICTNKNAGKKCRSCFKWILYIMFLFYIKIYKKVNQSINQSIKPSIHQSLQNCLTKKWATCVDLKKKIKSVPLSGVEQPSGG